MSILILIEMRWGGTRTYEQIQLNWDDWLEEAVIEGHKHLEASFGFFCLDVTIYGAIT